MNESAVLKNIPATGTHPLLHQFLVVFNFQLIFSSVSCPIAKQTGSDNISLTTTTSIPMPTAPATHVWDLERARMIKKRRKKGKERGGKGKEKTKAKERTTSQVNP